MGILHIFLACLVATLANSRPLSEENEQQIESYNRLIKVHDNQFNLWYFPSNSKDAKPKPLFVWFGDGKASALVDSFASSGPYQLTFADHGHHHHHHPTPSPCCKCICPPCSNISEIDRHPHPHPHPHPPHPHPHPPHPHPRPPFCPPCPNPAHKTTTSPSSSSRSTNPPAVSVTTANTAVSVTTTNTAVSDRTTNTAVTGTTLPPMRNNEDIIIYHKHHHHHHHHHHNNCCPCSSSSVVPLATATPAVIPSSSIMPSSSMSFYSTAPSSPKPPPHPKPGPKHDSLDLENDSSDEDEQMQIEFAANPDSWTGNANVVYFDFVAGFARPSSNDFRFNSVITELCKQFPGLIGSGLYLGGKDLGARLAVEAFEEIRGSNFTELNLRGFLFSLFSPEDAGRSELIEDITLILNDEQFKQQLGRERDAIWYPYVFNSLRNDQFSYERILKFAEKNSGKYTSIITGRDLSVGDLKRLTN